MIAYERALQLIQNSMSSLHRGGLLEQDVTVRGDTVLLGSGSPLDSIGFITFITDLEERLSRETNEEVFLVVDEFHEFNGDNPVLSVDTMARFVVQLTNGKVT
jgi:2-phospho-L-lactate transferase/gluconeogenesis factor (CofD/UPF0052 family)